MASDITGFAKLVAWLNTIMALAFQPSASFILSETMYIHNTY
jgi:hypothetical protein